VDQRARRDNGDVEALAGIPIAKPEMGHQSSACGAASGKICPSAAQPTGAEVRSFPLHYFPASKELFRQRNSPFEGTAGGSLGGRFDAADFAAGGNAANAALATTTKRPKLGVPGQAGDIYVMPMDSWRHES
jgi:hypothetical protein